MRALRCASSSSEKRAAARPTRAKSTVATRASSDVTGSTGSAVPSRASRAEIASASMPRSRSSPTDSEPVRLLRPPPAASTSSGRWAKTGTRGVERPEHLDLRAAVGDVILAADDMGDGEGDVVDHRGEAVEIAAVGAHQHRIALARFVDMLRPAHQIVPAHFLGGELEAPVRTAAFALQPRPVGVGEFQRRAVVDRRPALGEQALALELELLRRLVAGIEPARGDELVARRVVVRQPVRLLLLARPVEAEPLQVAFDRRLVLGLAARPVGVVEAQDEGSAMPLGEQPVEQRRAHVSDMQQPGGARRKTDDRSGGIDHARPTCDDGPLAGQAGSATVRAGME